MIPTILGFPLWRGKIKRRVAKKYLRRFRHEWMLKRDIQAAMSKLDVGDLINDCTGLNGKILEMDAFYYRIGTGKGAILMDVDIQTANSGCSLTHCGVEPALPREYIEARKVAFLKEWTLGEPGEHWYGKGTEKHTAAVAMANKIVSTLESGGSYHR
jgi:hypothetical protein